MVVLRLCQLSLVLTLGVDGIRVVVGFGKREVTEREPDRTSLGRRDEESRGPTGNPASLIRHT